MSDPIELKAWERATDEVGYGLRDLEAAPYDRIERRVVKFLEDNELTFGDDPIGELIALLEKEDEDLTGALRLMMDVGKQMQAADEAFELERGKSKAYAEEIGHLLVEQGKIAEERIELRTQLRAAEDALHVAELEKKIAREACFAAQRERERALASSVFADVANNLGGSPRAPLFVTGDFTAHSGDILKYKIEADALTDEDIATVAAEIARDVDFTEVYGIPRGGTKLAEALKPYRKSGYGLLIVDDVWTTGGSMEEERGRRGGGNVKGAVIFARGPCPDWVIPFLQRPDRSQAPSTAAEDAERNRLLREQVEAIIEPYGGSVVGLGPHAVNVQGDARTYYPSVIIRLPWDSIPEDELSTISNLITNLARVSRVLLDVSSEGAGGAEVASK